MDVARGFAVCWVLVCACQKEADDAKRVEARCDATRSDHDTLYERAVELIDPHLLLDGRKPVARNDGEVRVGIACLDRVVEIEPSNWSALWLRGKAFQSLGDHGTATESFRAAYRIEATNPDVARELVEELLETRHFDEAAKLAREVVNLHPQDAGLEANLALALLLDGQLVASRRAIAEALKLAPDDPISRGLEKMIAEVASGARPQPKTLQDLQP